MKIFAYHCIEMVLKSALVIGLFIYNFLNRVFQQKVLYKFSLSTKTVILIQLAFALSKLLCSAIRLLLHHTILAP